MVYSREQSKPSDGLVLGDIIRKHAKDRGDKIALVFHERKSSYTAFNNHTNQVANALTAMGIEAGDRIAFFGKNSDLYFEFWIGATKAGVILAPINWRLAPVEIARVLADCQPKLVLCDPDYLDMLTEVCACTVIVTEPVASYRDFISWRNEQTDEDSRRDAGYDEPALQLYTSGTTGLPKGAMLSHRNMLGLHEQTPPDSMPGWNLWTTDDISLISMPVFHISGSGWGMWAIEHGATGIILPEFDPQKVLSAIAKHRINKMMLVPTALQAACDQAELTDLDFSSLKTVYYGGSAIPLDLMRKAISVFGCGFAQMYGMTEAAGTIVGLPPEDHDPSGNERMRSVGLPVPGVEVKIVDLEGNELAAGEIGEILTRSVANMLGYHNRPEETVKTIDADGWLSTGDAGHLDADGYIYLADRIKDMIITGGENVYPAEVENALYSHPLVKDVAVIGVPDTKWGEAVKAIVVPMSDETPDPADLIAWARERIAGYKIPKSFDFRDDLPRNPSGKILRRMLRDEYQ